MIATTRAPFLYCDNSLGAGRRTFSTMSASLVTSSPISAPAASKSASGMPEALPAPRATMTSAPSALNFLTVSGVAATRGSPASVSRATAIRIRVFPSSSRLGVGLQPVKRENQKADHKSDDARGLGAGHQTRDQTDHRDDEDRQRHEPVPHHPADREAEHQVD